MSTQRRLLLLLLVIASLVFVAGKCQDSRCGPNAKCVGIGCRCKPGYYGRPPFKQCRPESDPECVNDAGCPANQACSDRLCENPCDWSCPTDHSCTTENHKAQCGHSIYPTILPPKES